MNKRVFEINGNAFEDLEGCGGLPFRQNTAVAGILLVVALNGCGAGLSEFRAGDSMLPTIGIGTRIDAKKLTGDPNRGRVIVFRAPEAPDREYLKRVIGLPGDTISVNDTQIVLNGAPIPRCLLGPWSYADSGGKVHTGELWLEALGGTKWLVFHDAATAFGTSIDRPTGPWTVGRGEVFVLGDNRENSYDSRYWFGGRGGGLPLQLIIGGTPVAAGPTLPTGAESLASALDRCTAALPGDSS